MAHKKNGEPRGRKSHFTGEKQLWLNTFHEKLHEAGDDPRSVYTDAANTFIQWYGYDLPFGDNVNGNPEDAPPEILPPSDDAEKKRRTSIRAKLRALHYTTRLKPAFDAIWAEAKKTLPATACVAMSQDHVRVHWEKEPQEFKDAIEEESQNSHRVAMEKWKAARKIPEGSAEEYHEAMESLTEVGIPMADALAEHLGSHVVILVVGPVGAEKGEVCLRTVFSDTSKLQTARTWAQFDHKGFTAMENSITRYGRAAFSQAECKACMWSPLESADLLSSELLTIDDGTTLAPVVTPAPIVTPAPVGTPVPVVTLAPVVIPAPVGTPASVITPAPVITPVPVTTGLVPHTPPSPDGIDAPSGPRGWLRQHEWSFYHPEEEGKLLKMRSRPQEFADWMKEHRQLKDYTIGPDFGAELFDWWKELGPGACWKGDGDRSLVGTVGGWNFVVGQQHYMGPRERLAAETESNGGVGAEKEQQEEEEMEAQANKEKAAGARTAKGKAPPKGKQKPAVTVGVTEKHSTKRKRVVGEEEEAEEQSAAARPKLKRLTRSAHALHIEQIQNGENEGLATPAMSSAPTPSPLAPTPPPPATKNTDITMGAPRESTSVAPTANSGMSTSAGMSPEETTSAVNQENSNLPLTERRTFVFAGSTTPVHGSNSTLTSEPSTTALAPDGAAVKAVKVAMDVDMDSHPLSMEMELELDPFANGTDLTPEELAEIAMDKDADDSDEDEDKEGEEDEDMP
ncbi:hypothetical protein K438DRAFT_2030521 [Mycena galopus ATCC 62051]|nr:hypothetical protein K438DRAFT_2030521 [Mycena galopus ATCC 62051]